MIGFAPAGSEDAIVARWLCLFLSQFPTKAQVAAPCGCTVWLRDLGSLRWGWLFVLAQ